MQCTFFLITPDIACFKTTPGPCSGPKHTPGPTMYFLKVPAALLKKLCLQKQFAAGLKCSHKLFAKPEECPEEKLCLPPCVCCNPRGPACFDLNNIRIVRAGTEYGPLITKFLYNYYWTREPLTTSLYQDVKNSAYIEVMTKKYSYAGDRFLAFYYFPQIDRYVLVGVGVASKVLPYHWTEAEQMSMWCDSEADRNRVAFMAHVLKTPNLFAGYRIGYLYNVDALCTIPEVAGFGVGGKLLDAIRAQAVDLEYPMTHVISTGEYMTAVCKKREMTRVWSVNYDDVTDIYGRKLFFRRYPHLKCEIYVNLYRVGL